MPGFGVWAARWWMPFVFIIVAGHLTNVCVTLFLHRSQTHRGVRLHYIAALRVGRADDVDPVLGCRHRQRSRPRARATELPPQSLIAGGVVLLMVNGAERNREFVADLEPKAPGLCEADVMGVAW